MNYVKHHNIFGVEAKEIPCIVGTGAPSNDITKVGLLYMDESTGDVYKRISSGWTKLSTTYTLNKSGSIITLTGSDGSSTSVTDSVGETVEMIEYGPAGTEFGLVKSGGDVTIDNGIITVNDNSHYHSATDINSGTLSADRLPSIPSSKITSLDASKLTGTVPTSALPSYVDDVIEGTYVSSTSFKNTSGTAITGETGKIYVDTSTNKTYRWSGSAFVEISASLALGETSSTAYYGDKGKIAYDHSQSAHLTLGETSSTAYRGDRGKIAYDHSQSAHAPSNAQANQNAFSNVKVGDTTIAADTTTDTLTLAGSNVTITPDTTNDKVTIGIASSNVTSALGYTPSKNTHKHTIPSYTPAGTVSIPTITVTPNTDSVNSITSVGTLPSASLNKGTLPSLTFGAGTLPSATFTQGTLPNLTKSVANRCLTLTFTAGTLPTHSFSAGTLPSATFSQGTLPSLTFSAGTLPTMDPDIPVVTSIKSATSTQPTFTGTDATDLKTNTADS